jgi:hypothetical protein
LARSATTARSYQSPFRSCGRNIRGRSTASSSRRSPHCGARAIALFRFSPEGAPGCSHGWSEAAGGGERNPWRAQQTAPPRQGRRSRRNPRLVLGRTRMPSTPPPVRGGVRIVPASTGSAAAAVPPCSTRGYSPTPLRGFKRDHAMAIHLTSSPPPPSPSPTPHPSPYARSECGRAAGFVEFPCRILPHPPLLPYRTPLISLRIRELVSRALSRLTLSLTFSPSSSSRSSRCLRVASR